MEDFMPCKGCDEPEACEIEGRCLEPVPAPLTDEEIDALAMRCCGDLRGDRLCMTRDQRLNFARKVLAATGVGAGGGGQGKEGQT
jgi:hypothetical protein